MATFLTDLIRRSWLLSTLKQHHGGTRHTKFVILVAMEIDTLSFGFLGIKMEELILRVGSTIRTSKYNR